MRLIPVEPCLASGETMLAPLGPMIGNLVIVEIKSVAVVLPVHEAQLLTQLKLAGKGVGLLLNFNVPVMKDGIIRKLNRAALEG